MKTYRCQEPPFCIQIELTEGCNLRCSFCGIQGIRTKLGGYHYMTLEVARLLAEQIANAHWGSRLELAMHGEPTLNPQMIDIVAALRQRLPRNQLMMTSNGSGLCRDTEARIQDLFNAGLNILALDNYKAPAIVSRLLPAIKRSFGHHYYPQSGLQYSPHRRWPRATQIILIVQDISDATAGNHDSINNHCGAGGPLNNSAAGKRCAKPFRELSVRWDGSVAGCCNDWRGLYKIGNICHQPLDQLWQLPAMGALRVMLYHGQRVFKPCLGCDALSYRVGLLPDPTGQCKIQKPTKEDLETIHKAIEGAPYTTPVLNVWEKEK